MLKILKERWALKEKELLDKISALTDKEVDYLSYESLLKMTFDTLEDINEYIRGWNTDKISVIDDGDYQGTLLFLIPFDRYQPAEYEYLMTYVGYGSCSGCDALQNIQMYIDVDRNRVNKELLSLCRDMVVNTIKPYSYGWRVNDNMYIEIDEEDEDIINGYIQVEENKSNEC